MILYNVYDIFNFCHHLSGVRMTNFRQFFDSFRQNKKNVESWIPTQVLPFETHCLVMNTEKTNSISIIRFRHQVSTYKQTTYTDNWIIWIWKLLCLAIGVAFSTKRVILCKVPIRFFWKHVKCDGIFVWWHIKCIKYIH